MNNLLNFFIKHSAWFIFAIYVILSLVLLFKDNPYQQSVYLTSANQVSAAVYKAFNGVTSYFHLRGINESLQERNAALEMELIELRNQMADMELLSPDSLRHNVKGQYTFVMAQVISNSIAQPNNYITINRGYLDGISPEMGVIDQNGVVGIVNVAGPHAARVISLLNPHIRLSCKPWCGTARTRAMPCSRNCRATSSSTTVTPLSPAVTRPSSHRASSWAPLWAGRRARTQVSSHCA